MVGVAQLHAVADWFNREIRPWLCRAPARVEEVHRRFRRAMEQTLRVKVPLR
jgi:hypothetical protein